MTEATFWSHIALLDGRADVEQDNAPLVLALRRAGRDAAIAFEETLAAALYELGRRSLARQPVRFEFAPRTRSRYRWVMTLQTRYTYETARTLRYWPLSGTATSVPDG